jgi:hypothetical protein
VLMRVWSWLENRNTTGDPEIESSEIDPQSRRNKSTGDIINHITVDSENIK